MGRAQLSGFFVCVICVASATCNRGPTAPSPSPQPAALTRLEIVGARAVAPGETGHYTALAQFVGGAVRDVTSEAVWRSDNSPVASISAPGIVRGHHFGEAHISAVFSTLISTTEVIVTAPGTFRMAGRIGEAGSADIPISGATVDVAAGPAAGATMTTGQDGRYRLYGVSGDTRIRISKSGYHPRVEDVSVHDHLTRDFDLVLAHLRADVAGPYTLTITAAAECADTLPEAARSRTYSASLAQNGPVVTASLTGASFVLLRSTRGNRFQGTVEGDRVTFSLTPYDWYYKGYGQPYADLVEELVPGSVYLVIDGTATVVVGSSRLTGTLDGSFQVFDGDPRWGPRRTARCRADNHDIVFSR